MEDYLNKGKEQNINSGKWVKHRKNCKVVFHYFQLKDQHPILPEQILILITNVIVAHHSG